MRLLICAGRILYSSPRNLFRFHHSLSLSPSPACPTSTAPTSRNQIPLNHLQRRIAIRKMSSSSMEQEESVQSTSTVSTGSEQSDGSGITVSEVLIELDDNLKGRLVSDLSSICEVDAATARFTLEAHKWNMQNAIDFLLESPSDDDAIQVVPEQEVPETTENVIMSADTEGPVGGGAAVNVQETAIPTPNEHKSQTEAATTATSSASGGAEFSKWAPEKFSIMSWNLDGLDDKNLEKRMEYVVDLVLREKHDVLFFQELLPYTFEYISRRLLSTYLPIPGTEDPKCEYLTATFLRKNSVYYEDHFVMPYPNSRMGRTLLVTKAFIGRAKLALLNSHLESTAEFSEQRTEQLKTCFDMAATFDAEYNVIFGGDLNLRDKEVGGSLPSSMVDLWVQSGCRKTCQYTWDLTRNTNKQMPSKYQPKCRFDRFYFRKSAPESINSEFFGVTGIERVPGTQSFPSDHWAIISFFALTQEARKPNPNPKKRKAEDNAE